jgi:hypothetical protein
MDRQTMRERYHEARKRWQDAAARARDALCEEAKAKRDFCIAEIELQHEQELAMMEAFGHKRGAK